MSAKQTLWHSVGKRKSAVARIWMRAGTGRIQINRRELEAYFGRQTAQMAVNHPLELTEQLGKVDITVTVRGGGIMGQAQAIRHGIARGLQMMDPELRGSLKKAGLLTRDARIKERKKYGQRGARARFQYSKR